MNVGREGEDIATRYLMTNGYRILERNWVSSQRKELDIIAFKHGTIHFVEVKTRSTLAFGHPVEAIDDEKLMHIVSAANEYRHAKGLKDYPFEYDSIGIILRTPDDYDLDMYKIVKY